MRTWLAIALDAFDLVPVVAGQASPLAMHAVRFAAEWSDDGLRNGEIGGVVHVDDVVQWIDASPALGFGMADPSVVAAVLSPDLDPSAADPFACTSVSAGFGFTAVPATLVR